MSSKGSVGIGYGFHQIFLMLSPGQEALAARVQARFRGAVQIQVGGVPYNCGDGASRDCGDLAGSSRLPPGLHLVLKLDATSFGPDATISGTVTVRNDGAALGSWDTGQPLTAVMVEPGTRKIVGTYGGLVAGTGYGFNLTHGRTATIRVVLGASRCDGKRGSVVPPGRYDALVELGPTERSRAYLTPEVPITVTR